MSERETRVLRRIKLREVSTVDRGANQDAHIVLWKRAPDLIQWLAKSYDQPKETFIDALSDMIRVEQTDKAREVMWPLMEALRESVTEIVSRYGGEDRTTKIRDEVEVFMSMCREKLASMDSPAGTPGDTGLFKEGHMDLKELEKTLGDTQTQLEALQSRHDGLLETLKSVEGIQIEATDDGAFRVAVEKMAPPEVIVIDGHEIEKGAPGFDLLKAQSERIAKMEEDRAMDLLAKRASAELPHLRGTDVEKGRLLRAVESLGEDVAKSLTESLKAADEAMAAMFKAAGSGARGEGDSHDPKVALEDIAKNLVETGQADDIVQARAQALRDPANADLRAQINAH